MIIRKLLEIMGTAIAILLGVLGLFLFGKGKGKEEEKQQALQKDVKIADEIKKQNDKIDMLPADDVRDGLRKYVRR